MPTTPRSQAALAGDPNFLKRLSSLLLTQAITVAGEVAPVPIPPPDPDPATVTHNRRSALAHQIITNPAFMTSSLAYTVANGTNLLAANTTYNFEALAVETTATDPEILSQIASLWDVMAGV